MLPGAQVRSTRCDAAVAVKFIPATFAFVMVKDWLAGLNV
jgi:hypothetical protein